MPERNQSEEAERDSQGSLTDLMRTGAQKLIAQALKAEATELLAAYGDERDGHGHVWVVRGNHSKLWNLIGVAIFNAKFRLLSKS